MAWLVSDARVLASVDVAETYHERRRGLRGRDAVNGALIIPKCRWIHTLGMRFPIDAAFVDDDGVVVKVVCMRPWRIGAPVRKASWVIEASNGAFERWGLLLGDVVELRDT